MARLVDGSQGLKLFYGNGEGRFVDGVASYFGARGYGVSLADLNGDGRTDIVGVKEVEQPATETK